jgi:hypothetical protein
MADRRPYSELRVTLPTFAVLILRQRARDRHLTVSAIVEVLIFEDVMMDELLAMARQSPDFGRTVQAWLRWLAKGRQAE